MASLYMEGQTELYDKIIKEREAEANQAPLNNGSELSLQLAS